LARFPTERNRSVDKKSRQIKTLERILIEKVSSTFSECALTFGVVARATRADRANLTVLATIGKFLGAFARRPDIRYRVRAGAAPFARRRKAPDAGMTASDPLTLSGAPLTSRLLLGTARYPSPAILASAIRAARADIVTVSLRREAGGARAGESFWSLIRDLGVKVLPNTAGCRTAKEAIVTAHMAREVFATDWIKLEVIGDEDTLQPDVFGLVEAARALVAEGFRVFPYTTEDLVVAEKLLAAGCDLLMPWAAPIGSGRGINNLFGLRALRAHFPDATLIVDAGLGAPSHAAAVMELGYDAVLLNTAVALAGDPVGMARAFALAVEAGRAGFLARPMTPRDMAEPSTPLLGRAFGESA
jgi:thiazole synthase